MLKNKQVTTILLFIFLLGSVTPSYAITSEYRFKYRYRREMGKNWDQASKNEKKRFKKMLNKRSRKERKLRRSRQKKERNYKRKIAREKRYIR